MLAGVLFVAGFALATAGVVRRVLDREPGESLVEAVWAPSRPQVAFTVGLVMMVAALVLMG